MVARRRQSYEYPDDIFDETRMSFGDHIEELRKHLLRAIYGLLIVLLVGFLLDFVGEQLGRPDIGVGRPMLGVIVDPVESQVRAFYARRNEQAATKLAASNPDRAEVERIRQKLRDNEMDTGSLSTEERATLLGAPEKMPVLIPTRAFEEAFGISSEWLLRMQESFDLANGGGEPR